MYMFYFYLIYYLKYKKNDRGEEKESLNIEVREEVLQNKEQLTECWWRGAGSIRPVNWRTGADEGRCCGSS